MKRIGWLVLVVALCLPILSGCDQPEETEPSAFEHLARWIPADAQQTFFLDLKPAGEAGRHWERIRKQLQGNPMVSRILKDLLIEFQIEEYGLAEIMTGPAVTGFQSRSGYTIAQVSDEAAAREALLQHFDGVDWQQKETNGHTLTYGTYSTEKSEESAWALHDGLLFWVWSYRGDPLDQLETILDLAEPDSLANLPSWEAVRARLPDNPMGLVFFNVAVQANLRPPPPGVTSPNAVLNQQIDAVGLAAIPEQDGMRVEIAGTFRAGSDKDPNLQALLDLPSVDPASWSAFPEDTALALFAHDASVTWLWLQDILGVNENGFDLIGEMIDVDVEVDLIPEDGPLNGDFVLAVTPPLPEQPISQGLIAFQVLIESRDATQAQVDALHTAMENRGSILSPGEIEGLALQTQVGTELTGYAFSYGFDDDLLLMGSSPGVIGRGIAAQRDGDGLVETDAFQTVLKALPDEPLFVVYLHSESLLDLVRANMTAEEAGNQEEYIALEAFESIGGGLRLQPDGLAGTIIFVMPD